MSAQINWDFAVDRWTQTMLDVSFRDGGEEVDKRCENLPPAFKARLIANLKGEDDGGEY
jgi:hypothetical protein